MNTVYIPEGDLIFPRPDLPSPPPLRELPVSTYNIIATIKGFALKPIEHMPLPTKLYGSLGAQADRILSTFGARSVATGVLAAGEKGSGKSLLARVLSARLRDANISTLVCNSPFCGDGFNAFIQSIEQPAMVLFDEFEKTYSDRKEQQQLLTLLDGTFPSKKLFMLTVNDAFGVNTHMYNRPGRLYYSLKFRGLEEAAIREYAEETLRNKDHMESLIMATATFQSLNFDMLKAIIEEMNRYNESAGAAMQMLNASPHNETASDSSFIVTAVNDAHPSKPLESDPDNWNGLPLHPRGKMHVAVKDTNLKTYVNNDPDSPDYGDEIEESDDNFAVLAATKKIRASTGVWKRLLLTKDDFRRDLCTKGALVFKKDGYTITFTPATRRLPAYFD